MRARHASAILLVVFILFVLACGTTVPPPPPPPQNHLTGPDNQPAPLGISNPPRDLAKEKPDLVWTSAEVTNEFSGNGIQFRQQYSDKIIELSGKVWDYDPFGWDAPQDAIMLHLEATRAYIICRMADREPWAKVVPGQPVKVRGRVPRDNENMFEPLVECVIIEPQQSPALQFTAEQLCRDARADVKKYAGKYMIVSGEVVSKKLVNGVALELKGDGQTTIRCFCVDKLKVTVDPIMVGQKIKVFGQYVTINPKEGVMLSKCLPILRNVN